MKFISLSELMRINMYYFGEEVEINCWFYTNWGLQMYLNVLFLYQKRMKTTDL